MPGNGQICQTHYRQWHVESGLVAEPGEPQDSASALAHEQSDGRGVQLRRGIQETQPKSPEGGPL